MSKYVEMIRTRVYDTLVEMGYNSALARAAITSNQFNQEEAGIIECIEWIEADPVRAQQVVRSAATAVPEASYPHNSQYTGANQLEYYLPTVHELPSSVVNRAQSVRSEVQLDLDESDEDELKTTSQGVDKKQAQSRKSDKGSTLSDSIEGQSSNAVSGASASLIDNLQSISRTHPHIKPATNENKSTTVANTTTASSSLSDAQADAVDTLVALGFNREECELALASSNYSIPYAVNWLQMRQESKLDDINKSLEKNLQKRTNATIVTTSSSSTSTSATNFNSSALGCAAEMASRLPSPRSLHSDHSHQTTTTTANQPHDSKASANAFVSPSSDSFQEQLRLDNVTRSDLGSLTLHTHTTPGAIAVVVAGAHPSPGADAGPGANTAPDASSSTGAYDMDAESKISFPRDIHEAYEAASTMSDYSDSLALSLEKSRVPPFVLEFRSLEGVSGKELARARWRTIANNLKLVTLRLKQITAINMVDAIRSLRASVRTLVEEERLCIVCFADEQNTVLLRCGHIKLCSFCAEDIMNSPRKECPICREPITRVVRVAPAPTFSSEALPTNRHSIRLGDFIANSPAAKRATLNAAKAALQHAADAELTQNQASKTDSLQSTSTGITDASSSSADLENGKVMLQILNEWHKRRAKLGKRQKMFEFEQALKEYLPDAISLLPRLNSTLSDLNEGDLSWVSRETNGQPIDYGKYYKKTKPKDDEQLISFVPAMPRSESLMLLRKDGGRGMRRLRARVER